MNIDNLHQLIGRYEQNYSLINNSKNDEIFKWRAVRCFQDVWFDDRYESYPFAEKFRAATRECSVLVDNGQVSPSNGIVKMAEQEPEEVEHLFNEVLFTDDNEHSGRRGTMTSIEFGKKCKPYLVQYRNIFGEVPQFSEYECNQDEFLQALLRATETKVNISTLLKKRIIDYSDPNIQY